MSNSYSVKECEDMQLLSIRTYDYVSELFKCDVDKGGKPYIGHLVRVANKCKCISEEAYQIGLLHDTIEDKNVSEEELISKGYSQKVVKGVALLSRADGQPYDEYIDNLIGLAGLDELYVKKADLEDNMDVSRLFVITKKDVLRVQKYTKTWLKIVTRIEELEGL